MKLSAKSEANQSDVAIKINNAQEMVFEFDEQQPQNVNPHEMDPHIQPIITENVPMKGETKPLNTCFIIANIVFNVFMVIQVVLFVFEYKKIGPFVMLSFTFGSYLIYLICAYHFSNLLPLTHLNNLHEYRLLYEKLTTAKCILKFKYIPSRNLIDQPFKIHQQQYKNIKIVDRSGAIYDVERFYSIVVVRYHKKYLFSENSFKTKVHAEFNQFVDKHKKESEATDKRGMLQSKQKIEFLIEGMVNQMGFYTSEINCYKFNFYLTVILGLGIYYQKYMQKKILRYQIDIVKEICPNQSQ